MGGRETEVVKLRFTIGPSSSLRSAQGGGWGTGHLDFALVLSSAPLDDLIFANHIKIPNL